MKRILLSATGCLTLLASVTRAQVQPCNTYRMQEIHTKNIPGYKEKLDSANEALAANYKAFLNKAAQRSSNVIPASYTFTIPVVFHILHMGGTENIDDSDCITALNFVNKDYARLGNDTGLIDPLFDTAYINSHIHFELAKKDPMGNCTNGIVHHYDENTNWQQSDALFHYIYSGYGGMNWSPSRYLNIYVVKSIIDDGNSAGVIIGYTYIPGTSPNFSSDAIVYTGSGSWLTNQGDVRSLSHEIGHWLGLSHTFGSSNDAGSDCGNDDIADTPKTTGFFSKCPKQSLNYNTPVVTTPADSSDVVKVVIGNMESTTPLNSATSTFVYDYSTISGTATTVSNYTRTIVAEGTVGGYSDFSNRSYASISAGSKNISVTSTAKSTDNNYVGVYMDFNRNGSFADAGEAIYVPTALVVSGSTVSLSSLYGTRTFSTVAVPTSTPGVYTSALATATMPSTVTAGLVRMRVITSTAPITNPNATITSGEFEDYLFNLNLYSCDSIRPNIENIMDYSSCPKMFTRGQISKMRSTLENSISNRDYLVDTANLVFTGIWDKAMVSYSLNPVTGKNDTLFAYSVAPTSPCAPIAEFASNKVQVCNGQSVTYVSTSYNYTNPVTYAWEFEGGTPSTSSSASQVVNYTTPGVYGTTLTVTNSEGTSTKSVSQYNHVYWNSDTISFPYIEDFETGVNFPDWYITNKNFGSITWQSGNYSSGTGSKCLMLPNANGGYFFGDVDIIESRQFNFTNTSGIAISYDYSYARKPGTTQDTVKFQYSTDCGGSWQNMLGMPSAASMAASGGTLTAPYVPWSQTKWVTKTYAPALTTALNNKTDVKFRFYFKNDRATGSAQNLYIDNINISGVVGIEELENTIGLSIFPNPTNASSTIEFTSPVDSKVNVIVNDVTGRLVEQKEFNAVGGHLTSYSVNQSGKLQSGVYFVTLSLDGQKVTKKLIVQ
jgi:PKD repeat protein